MVRMIPNYLKKFFKPKVYKAHNFIDLSNNYEEFFGNAVGVDAYHKNVVVYRCVNLIAQSAGHVPWVVNKNHHGNIIQLFLIEKYPYYSFFLRYLA